MCFSYTVTEANALANVTEASSLANVTRICILNISLNCKMIDTMLQTESEQINIFIFQSRNYLTYIYQTYVEPYCKIRN